MVKKYLHHLSLPELHKLHPDVFKGLKKLFHKIYSTSNSFVFNFYSILFQQIHLTSTAKENLIEYYLWVIGFVK